MQDSYADWMSDRSAWRVGAGRGLIDLADRAVELRDGRIVDGAG